MGKKQHQQDKLYITNTEWATVYGGKKKNRSAEQASASAAALQQNVLPLNFCALTLAPFTFPVTTTEGYVFDFLNLVTYLKARPKGTATNPVTGTAMTVASVVPLKFHRNTEDEFLCPVTFKLLNDRSHVVAIRCTGNVYSREAVDSFNLKPKHYKDLLTDVPFVPARDLIVLRDPATLVQRLNIGKFGHVLAKREADFAAAAGVTGDGAVSNTINYTNNEMESILTELMENSAKDTSTTTTSAADADAAITSAEGGPEAKAKMIFHAHYSQGRVAASFTCSTIAPVTEQKLDTLDTDAVRYEKIARGTHKKAYAQIQTSLGTLNVELHCEAAPRACENWLKLASSGFYDGLVFFRSIKHFVAQTGDPNETLEAALIAAATAASETSDGKNTKGKGSSSGKSKASKSSGKDEVVKKPSYSIWGNYFKDEFRLAATYNHTGRGILSMANFGRPDTNGSQFFITYRSCHQLDKKHTVFGRVVGGLETLDKMERIPTDESTDVPSEPISIIKCVVYVDPFKDLDEALEAEELAKKIEEEEVIRAKKRKAKEETDAKNEKVVAGSSSVGKYLKLPTA